MNYLIVILTAVLALGVGFATAWVISRRIGAKSLNKVEAQARRILNEAEKGRL